MTTRFNAKIVKEKIILVILTLEHISIGLPVHVIHVVYDKVLLNEIGSNLILTSIRIKIDINVPLGICKVNK